MMVPRISLGRRLIQSTSPGSADAPTAAMAGSALVRSGLWEAAAAAAILSEHHGYIVKDTN
jgi:hypothetical protein